MCKSDLKTIWTGKRNGPDSGSRRIHDFSEEIHKAIMKSPTKSCLLDLWPTFFVECLDILLPSITKFVFYCVNTSYPMDNCLSGRRRPACQTPEKDVLCYHWLAGP